MADGNTENQPPTPDQLAKLLELELQQKRAGWQQGRRRVGAFRAASFLFLFLVIIGGIAGWWFFMSPAQLNEMRANNGASASATPSATPAR